jgi:hypothetical protein
MWKSRGILVGITMVITSIQRVKTCDFFVNIFAKNKSDGFEWILVGVYGAAQDALKLVILME